MSELTARQLSIFEKYTGDIDGLLRSGTQEEKAAVDDQTWAEIAAFCQQLVLQKRGLLGKAAEEELVAQISDRIPDERVVQRLRNIAMRMASNL
ncbi:MAG: hypothetical protein ACREPN_01455 [Rudaea sp.]